MVGCIIRSACAPLLLAGLLGGAVGPALAAPLEISGEVQTGGAPVAGSAVTLWAAGTGAPVKLAEAKTGTDGKFAVSLKDAPEGEPVLYLVTKGGAATVKTGATDDGALVLLSVLGSNPPPSVVVNELTTVASAYTSAQFIHGDAISGNLLGLKIASGNAPNLVDPATGGWGKVLLDPLNSTQNLTLASINTLGSLVTAYATGSDDWRTRFLKAATPSDGTAPTTTIEALADIARESWTHPKDLYGLFDEAFPQPKDGSRRAAPFVPYLFAAPDDFALMLAFAGGGMYANGRFMFDESGNLWSGQNWMPGSQSGVKMSIGGGVLKMTPNGTPLSPPITGFTGMGIDGVGWGTAVTHDRVWITSFNGKILVMDFDGKPVATEADFPFKDKLQGLMGIGLAENGDIWIADGSDDQLLYFPGGSIKDGKIVKVAGLASPFDIVIDPQNRVWVSNSQSDTVVRFPADDPTKVETFKAGLVVRALALDSKGNVWVASNVSLDFPLPKVPQGASIMLQFELMGAAAYAYPKATGVISMIQPDGVQPTPAGYTGNGAVDIPWGLNIDGNDDVWAGNIGPVNNGVVYMAGAGTKGHPAGTQTGDVLHVFKSGSIQLLTDTSIDPAGNLWAANNWNLYKQAMASSPDPRFSTWGGGSGLTVIYGVAAPVKPPRIGVVKHY
jgi:hypothetical protein